MSTKTKLRRKLESKRYRDAFVASQISVGIPFQIRALRAKRDWDQKDLAERAGMLQPRISAIETPGTSSLNLKTLRRIASAFDVGLMVRFAPFSELIKFADDFSTEAFQVPDFFADLAESDAVELGSVNTGVAAEEPISNVYPISTGKRLQLVSGQSARSSQKVTTTKDDVVQQAQLKAEPKRSAETETATEYNEVNYG